MPRFPRMPSEEEAVAIDRIDPMAVGQAPTVTEVPGRGPAFAVLRTLVMVALASFAILVLLPAAMGASGV